MFALIGFVLATVAAFIGYIQARTFTEQRLRYVDGVHKLRAPILAGLAAALIATPVTWLLPFIGGGAAIAFGISVGSGVAAGARNIRRQLGTGW